MSVEVQPQTQPQDSPSNATKAVLGVARFGRTTIRGVQRLSKRYNLAPRARGAGTVVQGWMSSLDTKIVGTKLGQKVSTGCHSINTKLGLADALTALGHGISSGASSAATTVMHTEFMEDVKARLEDDKAKEETEEATTEVPAVTSVMPEPVYTAYPTVTSEIQTLTDKLV